MAEPGRHAPGRWQERRGTREVRREKRQERRETRTRTLVVEEPTEGQPPLAGREPPQRPRSQRHPHHCNRRPVQTARSGREGRRGNATCRSPRRC